MQSKLPVLPASVRTVTQQASGSDCTNDATGVTFAGVLSLHLEAGRCRVRCPFCYLGQRAEASEPEAEIAAEAGVWSEAFIAQLVQAVQTLPYREVAVTLSEPVEEALRGPLARVAQAAQARGVPLALTTTIDGAQALLRGGGPAQAVRAALSRLSVSIDPFKAPTEPAALAALVDDLRAALDAPGGPRVTLTLLVTLTQRRFAQQLIDEGLLAALVDLPAVDAVALNALKPPPPFCDRAFWLQALRKLGPLVRRHLDRRLFLDCYVAARLLDLGGCPGRPDVSQAPGAAGASGAPGAAPLLAYRSCVYQPAPDLLSADLQAVAQRLRAFVAPAACPFPIA